MPEAPTSSRPSSPRKIDLGDLGLDEGGHLIVKRALSGIAVGERVLVRGSAPELVLHLGTWCRAQGHRFEEGPAGSGAAGSVERGSAEGGRWRGAERAGSANARNPGAIADEPSPRWGLAARGAAVEAGGPDFDFRLRSKDVLWADDLGQLYRQAAAAQWDPSAALPWDATVDLPEEVETAVVQVMTYLIENENAALVVPARFLGQVHPHFKEVVQLLAIQVADEARHVEVFTRRALLKRSEPGLSTVGGQRSLKSLLDEPDFALASFLLSVLGEGSFLHLLWFLRDHAPDRLTREIARLTSQDEARHVAFGMAHLERQAGRDPTLRDRLAAAIQRRHSELRDTAGLNEEVFDALIVLAAGSFEPGDIRIGHRKVIALAKEMDQGRQHRLLRLGFDRNQAQELSSLHTRNFM
jgi:hypothetical protein